MENMEMKSDDRTKYEFYEFQMQIGNSDQFNQNKILKIEPSGLVIEENTVYEIDDECIQCLREKLLLKENNSK